MSSPARIFFSLPLADPPSPFSCPPRLSPTRPVTFVARNRSGTKTFFSVSFEITDAAPATEGGPKEVEGANGKPVEKKVKQAEEEVEISDEVD